jgi:hypothetical protein
MVFGLVNTTKLQNDVFCLTEERDYFQTKFLEQVSEIASLKEELLKSKKEIARLRRELMEVGSSQFSRTSLDGVDSKTPQHHHHSSHHHDEKKEDDPHQSDGLASNSSLSDEDNTDNDSAKDIRQSAEKLLQWASYRSIQRTAPSTPDQSVVSSTPRDSLLDQIPRTIGAVRIHDDDDESDDHDDNGTDDYDDDHDDHEGDESDLDHDA